MFGLFGKAKTIPTLTEEIQPPPREHTIIPDVSRGVAMFATGFRDPNAVRPGQWVMAGASIGILTKVGDNVVSVMHVDSVEGTNVLEEHNVHPGNLRKARYEEIPAKRRQSLSRDFAASLGYY